MMIIIALNYVQQLTDPSPALLAVIVPILQRRKLRLREAK